MLILGLIIGVKSVNSPLHHYELIDDAPFWCLPDDVADAYKPESEHLELNQEHSKSTFYQSTAESSFPVNKVYPEKVK